MKKHLLILSAVALALLGCSTESEVLNIYTWDRYIEPRIIPDFEADYKKQTGHAIQVNIITYSSNAALYNRIKRGESYDLICPSGFMLDGMIKENLLQPLDHSLLPPFEIFLQQWFNLEFDPGNVYSIPYTRGTTGILYNTTHKGVDPADMSTWGVFWNHKYKGRMLVNSSRIEMYLVALRYLNRDKLIVASDNFTYPQSFRDTLQLIMNENSDENIAQVKNALHEQRRNVKGYYGDERISMMVSGEDDCTVCMCWSDEAVRAMSSNKALAFCIPKEGSNYYVDSWAMPKTAKNVKAAYAFLRFMAKPENGMLNVIESCSPSMITAVAQNYANGVEGDPTFFKDVSPEWEKMYYSLLFFTPEIELMLAPYHRAKDDFMHKLESMIGEFYETQEDKNDIIPKE